LDRHVTQTYKLVACGVRESTLDLRLEYLFVELQRTTVEMMVLVIPVRCIHSPRLSQAVRADNRVRLTARSTGSPCCATLTAGYERVRIGSRQHVVSLGEQLQRCSRKDQARQTRLNCVGGSRRAWPERGRVQAFPDVRPHEAACPDCLLRLVFSKVEQIETARFVCRMN